MFEFLFGYSIIPLIKKIMEQKTTAPNNSVIKKYSNYKPNTNILNVLKIYEEGKLGALKTTAYVSKGDSNPTIGYGTVSLYNNNSVYVRDVKLNESFSNIKKQFSLTHLSDESAATQLMINYLSSSNKYLKIAKVLDASGVPFYENLAIGLFDFSFNSGGAFSSKGLNLQNFANEVLLANGNMKKIAGIYFKFRFTYVKTYKNPTVDYNANKGGWARRYYHNAKRIEGVNLNYSTLTKNTAINGAFSEYGFVV